MKREKLMEIVGENVKIYFRESCGGGNVEGLLEYIKEDKTSNISGVYVGGRKNSFFIRGKSMREGNMIFSASHVRLVERC